MEKSYHKMYWLLWKLFLDYFRYMFLFGLRYLLNNLLRLLGRISPLLGICCMVGKGFILCCRLKISTFCLLWIFLGRSAGGEALLGSLRIGIWRFSWSIRLKRSRKEGRSGRIPTLFCVMKRLGIPGKILARLSPSRHRNWLPQGHRFMTNRRWKSWSWLPFPWKWSF